MARRRWAGMATLDRTAIFTNTATLGHTATLAPTDVVISILVSTLPVYRVLTISYRKSRDTFTMKITHTCSYATGVYSIVMDVADVAGNRARARTVFFLDPLNNIEISENHDVTVEQGVTSDTGTWIADTGQLDFDWTGVFANSYHVRNNFMKSVAELHDTLDDTRPDNGNRTLAAVTNSNGMTHFEVFWNIGSSQTLLQIDPPQSTQLSLNPERADGDVVSLTVQGYDLSGHFKVGTRR